MVGHGGRQADMVMERVARVLHLVGNMKQSEEPQSPPHSDILPSKTPHPLMVPLPLGAIFFFFQTTTTVVVCLRTSQVPAAVRLFPRQEDLMAYTITRIMITSQVSFRISEGAKNFQCGGKVHEHFSERTKN